MNKVFTRQRGYLVTQTVLRQLTILLLLLLRTIQVWQKLRQIG